GVLSGLADALGALQEQGVQPRRLLLIGGAARSSAVQQIAPDVLGSEVLVPAPGEYVADGAGRQAAWALSGEAEPPVWELAGERTFAPTSPSADLSERYASARTMTLSRR